MFNHSCAITDHRQTRGVSVPPAFLQLFLLLVLSLTYGTGSGTRAASCCNSEQCHPNSVGVPTAEVAATAEAAPERAMLPFQPLRSLSLLQIEQLPSQVYGKNEEQQEELVVTKSKHEEAMEEENAAVEMGKNRGSNRSLRMTLRSCIEGFVRSVDYQLQKGTMAGALQALLFGLLSAASLPIGAVLGLLFSPVPPRVVALCMAFGSGALVYAVATDLFGEALHRLQDAPPSERKMAAFVLLAETISGVFGALLYLVLNRLLEEEDTGHSEAEMHMPRVPEASSHDSNQHVAAGSMPAARFNAMWTAARDPQPVPAASNHDSNQNVTAGNMPAAQVNATWTSARDLSFPLAQSLRPGSFPARVPRVSFGTIRSSDSFRLSTRDRLLQARASFGSDHTVASFHHEARMVSNRAKNVAMSMWLGVTLDGIPESVMMGFMAKKDRLTNVLVLSIFIANFPEAFSAASMLKSHNMNSWKIMLMWCSIFINTGLLAMVGWAIMPSHMEDDSPSEKAMDIITGVMEGITGGAMMAMTSTAMLPEAFHGAGTLSGLLFVSGFLVSVAVAGGGELLSFSEHEAL